MDQVKYCLQKFELGMKIDLIQFELFEGSTAFRIIEHVVYNFLFLADFASRCLVAQLISQQQLVTLPQTMLV